MTLFVALYSLCNNHICFLLILYMKRANYNKVILIIKFNIIAFKSKICIRWIAKFVIDLSEVSYRFLLFLQCNYIKQIHLKLNNLNLQHNYNLVLRTRVGIQFAFDRWDESALYRVQVGLWDSKCWIWLFSWHNLIPYLGTPATRDIKPTWQTHSLHKALKQCATQSASSNCYHSSKQTFS